MANVMVKYYSLEELKGKSISNKTTIDELGEATKEDTISWTKLESMDSDEAFEYLKKEMKLDNPDEIKGCRFLSDKQIMFVASKDKKMEDLGDEVKVIAILESSGEGKMSTTDVEFTVYHENKKICSFTLTVTDKMTKGQLEEQVSKKVKEAKSELKEDTITIWEINGTKGDNNDSDVEVMAILGKITGKAEAKIDILVEKPITFGEVIVTVTSESGQGLQDLTPAKNISIGPSKTLSDLLKKVGNVPEDYPVVEIKLGGQEKQKPEETDTLSKLLKDLQLGDKKKFNKLAIYVEGDFKNEKGENSYKYR